MTELAIPNQQHGHELAAAQPQPSPLMQWAMEARQAEQIAEALARSSFVPATMRGKPAEITAAILAGQELGMQPMAALRSIDIIHGTPGLRAHAMRGLVQSRGHTVQVVESTDTLCVMRGQRKGEAEWQQVEWTIERAAKLGLTKDQWTKQPRTMLIARATGEICRLIASDVLHAMPYAAEELGTEAQAYSVEVTQTGRATANDIIRRETTLPADEAQAPPAEATLASTQQLRDVSMLMTACGITGHTGKGSTTRNDEARFAWLTEFLGVPVEGSTKGLTAEQADRVTAHLRQQQIDRAQQRAGVEQQIGGLLDGLDTVLSAQDRLRDLSTLLGRTIAGPADLTDAELADIAQLLADCQGQTSAWDAAIQAAEAERQQEGQE